MRGNEKKIISELLETAGININGDKPWDMQVYNDQIYKFLLHDAELSLGESYVESWWDCERLDEFFFRIIQARLEQHLTRNKRLLTRILLSRLINFQTKKRALTVGKQHYDLGNLLFECMLDKDLNYTCGYWKNATTLEQAQQDKLDLVCQKLKLEPGMKLLDIGCGWGALAKHAAEKYGAQVVGITISKEQMQLAKEKCIGLPVEIRFQDYRDIQENFDRIVSLGMFEHVGHLNYRPYLKIVNRSLNDDGLFLLHTIGSSTTCFKTNAWINKYIFPNGLLPSIAQIGKCAENLFTMEDWHNFGADYDKTLLEWHKNFTTHWESKLKPSYDERFYRIWNYYLLSCAGGFRARDMQLWQIVFSKNGLKGGYIAPR